MTVRIFEDKNKRSRICKVSYAFTPDIIINNYPGDTIQVVGNFEDIRFSTVSFSEISEANGEQHQQELVIEIKGNSADTQKTISDITGKYCIVRLEYSNREIKIVGTGESPVMFAHEQSGIPVVNKLYVSRLSAEKSKYLIA